MNITLVFKIFVLFYNSGLCYNMYAVFLQFDVSTVSIYTEDTDCCHNTSLKCFNAMDNNIYRTLR